MKLHTLVIAAALACGGTAFAQNDATQRAGDQQAQPQAGEKLKHAFKRAGEKTRHALHRAGDATRRTADRANDKTHDRDGDRHARRNGDRDHDHHARMHGHDHDRMHAGRDRARDETRAMGASESMADAERARQARMDESYENWKNRQQRGG